MSKGLGMAKEICYSLILITFAIRRADFVHPKPKGVTCSSKKKRLQKALLRILYNFCLKLIQYKNNILLG